VFLITSPCVRVLVFFGGVLSGERRGTLQLTGMSVYPVYARLWDPTAPLSLLSEIRKERGFSTLPSNVGAPFFFPAACQPEGAEFREIRALVFLP